MPVRPLDLLDMPIISKYRHQVVMLDSARALTGLAPFSLKALVSYLGPRRKVYSVINQADGRVMLGQVSHAENSAQANLGFLAPDGDDLALLCPLLENMLIKAGEWGCLYLLAEVDENSNTFRNLRQAGLAMYAWQRAWRLPEAQQTGGQELWKEADESDLPAIQNLYSQIVPAMLQSVEPLPRLASGLVCHENGEIRAYLAITQGPAGIWVQPLIHPEANCQASWMACIPNRKNQPIYLCVRSYQAWLESILSEMGAIGGERQAVMIRHLAVHKRAEEALQVKKAKPAWAKPATPVANIKHLDGEH